MWRIRWLLWRIGLGSPWFRRVCLRFLKLNLWGMPLNPSPLSLKEVNDFFILMKNSSIDASFLRRLYPSDPRIKEKKKTAILSGNYRQFLECVRRRNLEMRSVVYADCPESVCGYRFDRVIEYGTYYDNPKYYEIKMSVMCQMD